MKQVNIDETKMIELYIDKRLTIRDCAKILSVSEAAVRRRLKKLGIVIRPPTRRLISYISDEQIIGLYWNEKLSISETAKRLGKSETFVKNRLKKSGIGTRTVREGARLWRNSEDITNEQLIHMHDTLGWSCRKISLSLGKSEEFVRQRFIVINKVRRKNIGPFNGSWKGGVTDIRDLVRGSTNNTEWRKCAFERQNYRSEISGQQTRELNCHHIYPFHIILQSSITKHKPLPDEYRNMAIIFDQRFYDNNNSLVLSKEEHDNIEHTPLDSHPWWKIWKTYPSFALAKSGLTTKDFECFEEDGKIKSIDYRLVKTTTKDVRSIIRYEHYLGTINQPSLILKAIKGNITIGIAIFGKGANKNLEKNAWELTRLCVPFYVVRPFACEFLDDCCCYIKQHHAGIKRLVSFADSSVGHNGGIYRMAGWQKAGKTPLSYGYFDVSTNQLRHKSFCRRIKGIDKTEKELANERGLVKIPLGVKYKYTMEL